MNLMPEQSNKITVNSVAFDLYSSFLKGAAKGPEKIKEVFFNGASNFCTESLYDLVENEKIEFELPLSLVNGYQDIEPLTYQLLKQGKRLISLGGDHSISFPLIAAHHKYHGPINLIQFDAHPDLYDNFDDNPYSHASPFARVMEKKLVRRFVQIGIRTWNPHQKQQAARFGIEVFDMQNLPKASDLSFVGPTYITLDLDALDPAFAPGVSHHEAGGLSSRQILDFMQEINADIIGADIVELNPNRDWHDMTAMAAVKFLKELAGKMLGV